MNSQKLNNPYYDKYLEIYSKNQGDRFDYLISSAMKRTALVTEYSWSIPTQEAVELIKKYSPVIEIGAGTGYWASLIAQVGGKINCFDSDPPGIRDNYYNHDRQYYPILPVEFVKWDKTGNQALFISWPPYDTPMGVETLRKYRGNTFIYIGESEYGCTGDTDFFRELEKNWVEVEGCNLPQWDGIHDHLTIYERIWR